MTVSKTFSSRSLSLLSTTTDSNGDTSTIETIFSHIKESAKDDDIYAVATVLKSLIDTNVYEVRINTIAKFVED